MTKLNRRGVLGMAGTGAVAAGWPARIRAASEKGARPLPGGLDLVLRSRQPLPNEPSRYGFVLRPERWAPAETAAIVIDMWDSHHSVNAARRVSELAPTMNRVVEGLRSRGVTIIHAPSGCLDAYADHPARRRALAARPARLPPEIDEWCRRIPSEEAGTYPMDQSDDANEEGALEREQWRARLVADGRGKRYARREHPALSIGDEDFISDRGSEVWSILQERHIDQVLLMGVHTNMCVLGRPFGLRQLAKNGKRPVLVRDLTDTMYNPARAPHVSHFTGTDLIIEHIEKFVAPTVTSAELAGGGRPFRFRGDQRPHIVLLVDEDEYRTATTLPAFARAELGRDFRTTVVHGNGPKAHTLPGMEMLDDADVVLVSVRRRSPPATQMQALRRHVESGKAVVGIRTASHAFDTNAGPPQHESWRTFDPDVLGGSYRGHHPAGPPAKITLGDTAGEHPILSGVDGKALVGHGSLYQVSPLHPGTRPLLMGAIDGKPAEPVAWTFVRSDAGRSFYTSLGHPEDFGSPPFVRLLKNAIAWAAGLGAG